MERMAGEGLGIDLREGLSDPGQLRDLRRALRTDKLIPRSLGLGPDALTAANGSPMAPERSEPGFSLSGSYQPEVAYGA
jgi:hypothetical protein